MDFPKTVPGVNLLAGQFTDGNPAEGIPASLDPAEWANAVTNEILNVMVAGGQTPDETKSNQLLAAIQALMGAESIPDATDSAHGLMSSADKTKLDGVAAGATANAGTVTAVTVANANGVTATVADQGTTPALTFSLGDIAPSSITSTGAIVGLSFDVSSSDRRLKRNILKVLPRPLHRKLPFVRFERILDGTRGLGTIAQYVQKLEPDYVVPFKLGRKQRLGVDYKSLAYEIAMWGAREIDAQAATIRELESRIRKIETRMAKFGGR